MSQWDSAIEDQVLNCPMNPKENAVGASSVREYLCNLLATLWEENEGFSGKRPFGDSGWQYEVYIALSNQGLITGLVLDEEFGYIESFDYAAEQNADKLIIQAIKRMSGV